MSKKLDPDAFKAWAEKHVDEIVAVKLRADMKELQAQEQKVAEIVALVREESGIEEGCPLCGGHFNDMTGECSDCGIDILLDWELGA